MAGRTRRPRTDPKPLTAHRSTGRAPTARGLVAAAALAVLPMVAVTAPAAVVLAAAAGVVALLARRVAPAVRGLGTDEPTRVCLGDRCVGV